MKTPVRTLLLAAGLGTRLQPITLKKPKCLVTIGGKPLLERWLKSLESCGCTDALINTHYLAEQVQSFLDKRPRTKLNIQSSYEAELLGTAGTLLKNQSFFNNCTGLLIHADNATDFNLLELLNAHKNRPDHCLLTMLTFRSNNPQSCGIVEVDKQGIVEAFYEKVKNPPGNLANGAIYAFDSEFINTLNSLNMPTRDLSTEVLPKLIGKIATYHTERILIDIGTPEKLKEAQMIWREKTTVY